MTFLRIVMQAMLGVSGLGGAGLSLAVSNASAEPTQRALPALPPQPAQPAQAEGNPACRSLPVVPAPGSNAVSPSKAFSLQIALRPQAVVGKPWVVLGDIALLETTEHTLLGTFSGLQIATAPPVGQTRRLKGEQLQKEVMARLGKLGVTACWHGANEVQVRRASQKIDKDMLVDAAINQVRGALYGQFDMLQLSGTSAAADIDVPLGQVSFLVRLIQQQEVASRVPVWVDVLVDGHFFRSALVTVEAIADRLQAFAARDLPAGAVLSAGDTEMRFVRVERFSMADRLPGKVEAYDQFNKPGALCLLEGMRVRVPVRRDGLLTALNLLPADAVVRGDLVDLRVQEGDVALLMPAVVQQNGRRGDRVHVTIAKSGKGGQGYLGKPSNQGGAEIVSMLAEVRGRNLVHAVDQVAANGASR